MTDKPALLPVLRRTAEQNGLLLAGPDHGECAQARPMTKKARARLRRRQRATPREAVTPTEGGGGHGVASGGAGGGAAPCRLAVSSLVFGQNLKRLHRSHRPPFDMVLASDVIGFGDGSMYAVSTASSCQFGRYASHNLRLVVHAVIQR